MDGGGGWSPTAHRGSAVPDPAEDELQPETSHEEAEVEGVDGVNVAGPTGPRAATTLLNYYR